MATCRSAAGAGGGEAGGGDAVVDIEGEEREVLSMAFVMGIGRQDVERALLASHGDWEFVLQVPAFTVLAPFSSHGRETVRQNKPMV